MGAWFVWTTSRTRSTRCSGFPSGEAVRDHYDRRGHSWFGSAVTRVVNNDQLATGPALPKLPGDVDRRTQVDPAVDQDRGYAGETAAVTQQASILEPGRVMPVVGDDACECHAKSWVLVTCVGLGVGMHRDVCILPTTPIFGRLLPNRPVRIVQQAGVSRDEITVPIRLRYAFAKPHPGLREIPPDVTGDPVDLSISGGDDADQGHLRPPVGKTLPIRQGERRTPRAAEDQPAVDREVFAEPLDISNQVVSRVGRKIHRIVARVRNTSAASTLVEQHDPVRGRIEKSAHARRASRARAAVEEQCRLPLGVATNLPIDEVAVADVEHALVERLDRRVHGHKPNFAWAAAYRPSLRKLSASTPRRRDTSNARHCSGTTLTIGASSSSIAGVSSRAAMSVKPAAAGPTASVGVPISWSAAVSSAVRSRLAPGWAITTAESSALRLMSGPCKMLSTS